MGVLFQKMELIHIEKLWSSANRSAGDAIAQCSLLRFQPESGRRQGHGIERYGSKPLAPSALA